MHENVLTLPCVCFLTDTGNRHPDGLQRSVCACFPAYTFHFYFLYPKSQTIPQTISIYHHAFRLLPLYRLVMTLLLMSQSDNDPNLFTSLFSIQSHMTLYRVVLTDTIVAQIQQSSSHSWHSTWGCSGRSRGSLRLP